MIVDHGDSVFSFEPVSHASDASSILPPAEGRFKKQAASNARKQRKRPKPWKNKVLRRLPYADAARQVLTRGANRKPMHFRIIAEKAVGIGLVRGPVEDAASTMLTQLLEERRRRDCRFTFHGEGLIGLIRWGSA